MKYYGVMKNAISLTVAHNVKKLRVGLGLTQERLAELIKTSYKYMQRIEGKTPPDIRLSTLQRLAVALKTTASKILQ